MFARAACACLAVALLSSTASAQGNTGPAPSRKAQVIGIIVGATAGFTAGMLAGLSVHDDALHSERKIMTLSLTLAAAGGTAGFLVGRAASRRGARGASSSAAAPVVYDRLNWGTPILTLRSRHRVPAPPFDRLFRVASAGLQELPGAPRAESPAAPGARMSASYFRSE